MIPRSPCHAHPEVLSIPAGFSVWLENTAVHMHVVQYDVPDRVSQKKKSQKNEKKNATS